VYICRLLFLTAKSQDIHQQYTWLQRYLHCFLHYFLHITGLTYVYLKCIRRTTSFSVILYFFVKIKMAYVFTAVLHRCLWAYPQTTEALKGWKRNSIAYFSFKTTLIVCLSKKWHFPHWKVLLKNTSGLWTFLWTTTQCICFLCILSNTTQLIINYFLLIRHN